MNSSARIRIHGKVQGVWFRGWIVREAAGHGLRGWVRNRTDGSVEALFAGDPTAVRQMIDGCHGGPPGARVDRIEEHPGTEPVPAGFVQLPTC
ncbi:MAG: acylphosphatase [Geminicoccaceae bacterium]